MSTLSVRILAHLALSLAAQNTSLLACVYLCFFQLLTFRRDLLEQCLRAFDGRLTVDEIVVLNHYKAAAIVDGLGRTFLIRF